VLPLFAAWRASTAPHPLHTQPRARCAMPPRIQAHAALEDDWHVWRVGSHGCTARVWPSKRECCVEAAKRGPKGVKGVGHCSSHCTLPQKGVLRRKHAGIQTCANRTHEASCAIPREAAGQGSVTWWMVAQERSVCQR
jgi:hypothetical protein